MTEVGEIGVIGDVHGCHDQLVRLVEAIPGDVTDLVFVGDLVNRGPAAREVLDLCLDLAESKRLRFVRGNHDEEFLRYIETGELSRFLAYGGASTLRSYFDRFDHIDLRQLHRRIPRSHVELLRSMTPAVVISDLLVTHRPDDVRPAGTESLFRMSGHRPTGTGLPVIERNHALIDTGCGTVTGAPLTCVAWPSLRVFQAG